ncbi:COP1, putative [Acanthamoeba castellanii str. Neff]|uniref:COP1, putative n=1 Tax=Acanthamoeba castellanii (strain ATCC 30010 / Neff) TaxID=1257118 RepID=L8GIR5_ACACF|nr:COP1, putative [Acanthamoeba castellanii str. Neff]ELR12061.1 COP1, putative [Acanthamoeba castellanii str. Neff]
MCPTCKTPLRRDQLFPNYALNAVLEKVKTNSIGVTLPPLAQLENVLTSQSLALADVNKLLGLLLAQKRSMESETKHEELELLLDFLYRTKQQHKSSNLNGSYDMLEEHIKQLERQKVLFVASQDPDAYGFTPSCIGGRERSPSVGEKRGYGTMAAPCDSMNRPHEERDQLVNKKRRIVEHMDELQQTYFRMLKAKKQQRLARAVTSGEHDAKGKERRDVTGRPGTEAVAAEYKNDAATTTPTTGGGGAVVDLDTFGKQLQKLVRFNGYEIIAAIQDPSRGSAREGSGRGQGRAHASLVTSIEFDKEGQHFAVAGYNKRIRVFDYRSVVEGAGTTHFPVHELTTLSRLSCVSWNGYIRSQLAGSEYSGRVSVWDLNTSQLVCKWHEHEKRAWSVHFAPTHPTRIVSASDDTKVKLWSMNQRLSAGTIEVQANVCSVKFHPESPHYLAFGAADHQIHYYDARSLREPLFVLRGHDKAVSHIQFLDSSRLVSASIDGTLRLWDVNTAESLLSFSSHVNKRLFVGLSVHGGEWITTGSENNQVYTYHKDFKTPLYQYSFDEAPSTATNEGDFISAVCYQKTENVILAANSRGLIQALQLK